PGHGQLIVCRRKSGGFAKLHHDMSTTLALMVRRDPAVSAKTLRSVLASCFPNGVSLKAQMLLNIRNRAKMKCLTMDQNDDLISARERLGSHIEKGLDYC
ncbi:MAG: hypothetical protein ACREOZ_00100, partial [Gloeomargaritales cyanobacterium]